MLRVGSLLLGLCACSDAAQPPSVLPPVKLAVLAGPRYTPAPGQEAIGFYGADLGVTLQHHDELRFLFGDTWIDASGALIGSAQDDAQGVISMRADANGFPDGDAVDAYVSAHARGPAFFEHAGPPLVFELDASGKVAAIELYRGGDQGQPPINTSVGKTVVTAFSNGRDGAFAIFRRDIPVACTGGARPKCDAGFSCDEELGICSNSSPDFPQACVFGSARCGAGADCQPVAGGGLCQDRTSSMYKPGDEDGRLEAVVIEHDIGNADLEQHARYYTSTFATNKFTNPIAKTVRDFDPERADPSANDYRAADGSHPEREKVLLWGRPHTLGEKSVGRDSRLYFGYADMPEYSPAGPIGWRPRYLSAIDHGRPTWSDDQRDAIALDLGSWPDPAAERFDVVDKMAISFVAPLDVWVMLYGGDFAPPVLNLFAGPNYGRVQRDPNGAIHARFARQPWGPWSDPVPALEAGDPDRDPPLPGSEYASGGMLRHPGCKGPSCIPGETALSFFGTPYGFLYAPNIIDAWTESREAGRAADVYWNVSTWNPYETVLLRTRIRR